MSMSLMYTYSDLISGVVRKRTEFGKIRRPFGVTQFVDLIRNAAEL